MKRFREFLKEIFSGSDETVTQANSTVADKERKKSKEKRKKLKAK